MSPTASEQPAGVRAKIDRAKQHIHELEIDLRAFAANNEQFDTVSIQNDPDTGEKIHRVRFTNRALATAPPWPSKSSTIPESIRRTGSVATGSGTGGSHVVIIFYRRPSILALRLCRYSPRPLWERVA
jgi:hypothetical protein